MRGETDTQDLKTGREPQAETILTTKILVVDDDESMCNYLHKVLSDNGYRDVDLVADSNQALERLKTFRYHVILADVILPGMNGFELLDHIHTYYGSVAVVMITGTPDVESAVEAVKKGAYDYLAKPIHPQKLLDCMASVLQRQREQQVATHAPMLPGTLSAKGYKVIRNLGSGTMGIVVLTEKDGKNYAVKLLRDEDSQHSVSRRQRFVREGEILAQVDHPCIVKIYEQGVPGAGEEGNPYIVMEFVPGNPLNRLIEQKSLEVNDKIGILSQIASALDAVHRHGVMHRDIKPANVLVTNEMHAKLMDFGVARVSDSALTMTAEMIGSPAYMAPECFEKKRGETDARADIFSLGVVGYELFTGVRPFGGRMFVDLVQSIRTGRPAAPRTLAPDLPEAMENILARMLMKEPQDRFQRAGEIVDAIKQMKASALMRTLKKDIGFRSLMRMLVPPKRVWQ